MDGEFFKEDNKIKPELSSESKSNLSNWHKKFPQHRGNVFDSIKYAFKHKTNSEQYTDQNKSQDAQFVGWEKTPKGEVFALYNVLVKNHPLYHSTVSEKTLREQNLKIPPTPTVPKNFKKFNFSK